jgi:hypothetical protein
MTLFPAMKTKSNQPTESRPRSLKLGAARLHARIAGRLSRTSSHFYTPLVSTPSLFDSMWSPVRLDLLKSPLTRYRE